MTDNEFYQCLHEANKKLIKNYYSIVLKKMLSIADELYINKNPKFRGFRDG